MQNQISDTSLEQFYSCSIFYLEEGALNQVETTTFHLNDDLLGDSSRDSQLLLGFQMAKKRHKRPNSIAVVRKMGPHWLKCEQFTWLYGCIFISAQKRTLDSTSIKVLQETYNFINKITFGNVVLKSVQGKCSDGIYRMRTKRSHSFLRNSKTLFSQKRDSRITYYPN